MPPAETSMKKNKKGTQKHDTLKRPGRRTSGRRKDERDNDAFRQLMADILAAYAIITTNAEGKVETWNKGAETLFRYKESEIVGKPVDIIFTAEDREAHEAEKERTESFETGEATEERWHIRKGGSRVFVSGVMVPLYDHGRHVGFGKIASDLTSRLETETALRDRQILHRLVATQEEERQRISRDLHDHLGQQLTALRLKIEGLKANYGAEPAMIKALHETQLQAKKIDDDVSFLTWELRPTALDNLGLKNALGNFVAEWSKNYGIGAEFHSVIGRRRRLLPEIEINLYRIAQEALNNVLKHAKASKVDVLLEYGKDDVVLVIEDDGRGFNTNVKSAPKRSGQGLGIIGMRERAALLGGSLEIESTKGSGTTVIARMPLRFVESTPDQKKKSTD